MLAPSALMRGLVSRLLPSPNADSQNIDVAARFGRYGEQLVMPTIRKSHALADEGSYFVAHNNQTGVNITTTAAFDATKPFILIYNSEPAGGPNLYLDYIALLNTTAGSAASGLTYTGAVMTLDSINRYSSAGSALTVVSPNQALALSTNVSIYAGQVVAAAASAAARTVMGLRNIRPAVSGTVAGVVGDNILFNFGGVEGLAAGNIVIANPSIIPVSCPPIVIGPGQCAMLAVFYAASGTPVASAYVPEVGFWKR